MTSELTDTEHDAVDWLYEMGAIAPRHLRLANEAFGRHRETVRAEQAAELAKFKALAETLAGALEEIQNLHYGTEAYSRVAARIALRQYKEARDAS